MELDSQTSRGWYVAPRTRGDSEAIGSPQPLAGGTPSFRIYFNAMLDLIDLVDRGHVGAVSWPQRLTRLGLSHFRLLGDVTSLGQPEEGYQR